MRYLINFNEYNLFESKGDLNSESQKIRYETKLQAVYESVVEFVEWYNERKQREEGN